MDQFKKPVKEVNQNLEAIVNGPVRTITKGKDNSACLLLITAIAAAISVE